MICPENTTQPTIAIFSSTSTSLTNSNRSSSITRKDSQHVAKSCWPQMATPRIRCVPWSPRTSTRTHLPTICILLDGRVLEKILLQSRAMSTSSFCSTQTFRSLSYVSACVGEWERLRRIEANGRSPSNMARVLHADLQVDFLGDVLFNTQFNRHRAVERSKTNNHCAILLMFPLHGLHCPITLLCT